MGYLEFEIPVRSWNRNEQEILMAELSQIGFEGFVEKEHLIQAYILSDQFSGEAFHQLIEDLSRVGIRVQYRFHETAEQNWNEEWEKKYKPVVIKNRVLIRAPFHSAENDLPCTLIIEPKMSFGTGHHQTTRMMIEEMMDHNLNGKRVLDMGCGTGILGILACRLGADRVVGIDHDQWAYENALENVERNGAKAMEIRLGDASLLTDEVFDVVLANITRNIVVRDIPVYHAHLSAGGLLLISGFLAEEVQYLLNAAYQMGLDHLNTREYSSWISLSFVKP
jgi:ribosomal protein L11 methyltransferase